MARSLEVQPVVAEARFDRTALKVNQAVIVALLVVAFVVSLPWLVALVAVVIALGTISPQLALFQRLYRDLLRPAGLLRPSTPRTRRRTALPRG
jgi:hypothetical protein